MLSAKVFIKREENNYKKDFKRILSLCVYAHEQLIKKEKLDNLKEEVIRNKLLEYIHKKQGAFGLAKYVFEAECAEIDEKTNETVGFIDIKVIIPCNSDFSEEEQNNYKIECKRLDGYYDKNREYVEEGMNRFIDEKYKCKFDICGMIGFIEKSGKKYKENKIINIVKDINDKLENIFNKKKVELLKIGYFINRNFRVYESKHIRTISKKKITISHLFLDNTNS